MEDDEKHESVLMKAFRWLSSSADLFFHFLSQGEVVNEFFFHFLADFPGRDEKHVRRESGERDE